MAKDPSALRSLLGRRSLLIANLVILLVLGWNFAREFTRSANLADEIQHLEDKKQELERKNSELSVVSQGLATSSALEREARVKLGLQLPGESVVVVKDNAINQQQQTEQTRIAKQTTDHSAKTNAKKWWRFFFHAK